MQRDKASGRPLAPPKFEKATVAPEGDLPRVIEPRERAPVGLTRFKIRHDNGVLYHPQSRVIYILAHDRASAEKHYLEQVKLATDEERVLAGADPAKPQAPRLVVSQLPD